MRPLYLENLSAEEIKRKASQLESLLSGCRVCPHECGINRKHGEKGFCGVADKIIVSSFGPHFGEEAPLVGTNGSGTVFFAGCNMNCVFCQNYDISHFKTGTELTAENLAEIMLNLQNRGVHNVNLVTPTHYTPQIAEALAIAVNKGFELPLVYNCGGYESAETLRLLENIVDIYMPDLKYSDDVTGEKFSGIKNYWETAKAALAEMHRQVGDLKISKRGIAQRGILIRHLVLPNGIAGSENVLKTIAELSTGCYVNIMDQYYPAYKAMGFRELNRHTTKTEFESVVNFARSVGLHRGFGSEFYE